MVFGPKKNYFKPFIVCLEKKAKKVPLGGVGGPTINGKSHEKFPFFGALPLFALVALLASIPLLALHELLALFTSITCDF